MLKINKRFLIALLTFTLPKRQTKQNRSEELVKLGYTNVKEFGGIIDWEYEIVK